ncbi:uncharacterized protein LOC108664635 [Hyalella azteca]|uniref:Uncharacterized protein LOC108664635 n=1 Tax=Hyalella azteca TaxID=294128 RepID=A0A8B7MZP2_HYAAZ|nr:uncharacterized protein LOC108664635 [Hyalella azteca]
MMKILHKISKEVWNDDLAFLEKICLNNFEQKTPKSLTELLESIQQNMDTRTITFCEAKNVFSLSKIISIDYEECETICLQSSDVPKNKHSNWFPNGPGKTNFHTIMETLSEAAAWLTPALKRFLPEDECSEEGFADEMEDIRALNAFMTMLGGITVYDFVSTLMEANIKFRPREDKITSSAREELLLVTWHSYLQVLRLAAEQFASRGIVDIFYDVMKHKNFRYSLLECLVHHFALVYRLGNPDTWSDRTFHNAEDLLLIDLEHSMQHALDGILQLRQDEFSQALFLVVHIFMNIKFSVYIEQ